MATLLIKNAELLVTMDEERREITDGAIFIRNGVIEQVGSTLDLPDSADRVVDLKGHIVIPGLVNTHHHLYQGLTKVIPKAQNASLFNWLKTLYPIWSGLTAEAIRVSTLTGLAELILSGCTTASDHLYILPNDCELDNEIEAAQTIGMRFHAMRGSMSIGESKGGLPPDSVVEEEKEILKDCRRLIETYHDSSPYSMTQLGVAPCSPFSVSKNLMIESAELARDYGVRLHTHLAENSEDLSYGQEKFGMTPGQYISEVNWTGEDVWFAHCVHLTDDEIRLFAETKTGVCHCPNSNMRLASGIAPIRKMLDNTVTVGLGVDGAASNDAGNLLAEARQAMLLQRVLGSPDALTARSALEIATRGGATTLGRRDIGHLAPNMAADFVAYDLRDVSFSGTLEDPLAALLFCQAVPVNYSVINGKFVVEQGILTTIDLPSTVQDHNRISHALINGTL
ncbi:MAG: 8-oxoguanine deaminase [Proteobacteria bacterium]|nr:8-oxoguanine deaminase [Pseudomonadota bacterium]